MISSECSSIHSLIESVVYSYHSFWSILLLQHYNSSILSVCYIAPLVAHYKQPPREFDYYFAIKSLIAVVPYLQFLITVPFPQRQKHLFSVTIIKVSHQESIKWYLFLLLIIESISQFTGIKFFTVINYAVGGLD